VIHAHATPTSILAINVKHQHVMEFHQQIHLFVLEKVDVWMLILVSATMSTRWAIAVLVCHHSLVHNALRSSAMMLPHATIMALVIPILSIVNASHHLLKDSGNLHSVTSVKQIIMVHHAMSIAATLATVQHMALVFIPILDPLHALALMTTSMVISQVQIAHNA
jgi:hypothetical protein